MNKLTIVLILIINVITFNFNYAQYTNGVVSTSDISATEIGIQILKNGGNAIDAAVAVGFALAVVYPQAGNLGGGGFMIIQFGNGNNTFIDFRETAPMSATKDMYLDAEGEVIEDLSTSGHLSAGVPGSVAGLLYVLEKYGTMTRQEVIQPSISLAENGFKIHQRLANALNRNLSDFKKFSSTSKIFGKKFSKGYLLKQPDLALTLKLISEYGNDGFYKGVTADKIIGEMTKGNGIISYEDLLSYRPKERNTLRGTYRGYDILTLGPPSSGGICLIYLLNILENFDLSSNGYGNINNIHLMAEAMRRVYADRSEFMGDEDFANVPKDIMISKKYAKERMKDYQEGTASKSRDIKPGDAYYRENNNTTHYTIADKHGNVVCVTTTINDEFGSKVIVDGAGFFLSNSMDDFSIKPGHENIFGLLGGETNAIAPGKRMLSSMTPTIVLKDNKPYIALGSPGGGKIITTVLQTIVNIIDYGYSLQKAIDLPRFHHQWYPDLIMAENDMLNKEKVKFLKKMGYDIKTVNDFGRVDAIIFYSDGTMEGHSDRRGYGISMGF